MLKILVFGSCNIDSVYSVDHIVRPGETLSATECETYPGGKGFNQAMAIAQDVYKRQKSRKALMHWRAKRCPLPAA